MRLVSDTDRGQGGHRVKTVHTRPSIFSQDDSRFMRLVAERIAKTEGKVVIESELKLVLGFTGKKGHRLWRRIKVCCCVCCVCL